MYRLWGYSRIVFHASTGKRASRSIPRKSCSLARLFAGCVAIGGLTSGWLLAPSGAHASSIEITGSLFGTLEAGPFPGYGNFLGQNNVVGYTFSGITDSTKGAAWLVGGGVFSNTSAYKIDWYFNGAESGDAIRFASKSLRFTENDQSNSFSGGKQGWLKLGTTSGNGLGPIPFSLKDLNTKSGFTNGSSFTASLMLAYVEPVYVDVKRKGRARKILAGWNVTTEKTDWFAFGFNDSGSSDGDYDDYVGVGHVIAKGYPPTPTPIPGAIALMGSVLGGGYILGRWRKWQARRLGMAAA